MSSIIFKVKVIPYLVISLIISLLLWFDQETPTLSLAQSPLPTPTITPTAPIPNLTPNPVVGDVIIEAQKPGLPPPPPPTLVPDFTPPTTTLLIDGVQNQNGWYRDPITLTFNAIDNWSGMGLTWYNFSDDPQWYEFQYYYYPIVVDTEGARTLQFYSEDNNLNPEPFQYATLNIDLTPPTVTHTLDGTLVPGGLYLAPVTVNLEGEDNLSGIDAYEMDLDGTGWQTTASLMVSTTGPHTVTYRATDLAGNVSAAGSALFTLRDPVQFVVEAEAYDATQPRSNQAWPTLTYLSNYTGTGYVTTTPDRGVLYETSPQTTAPELQYDLTLPFTGTYHLWLRGAGADAEGDEIYAALVEQSASPSSTLTLTGFPPYRWGWSKQTINGVPATFTVTSTGTQRLYLWPREDGVSLDRILLTDNPDFTPVGVGPSAGP